MKVSITCIYLVTFLTAANIGIYDYYALNKVNKISIGDFRIKCKSMDLEMVGRGSCSKSKYMCHATELYEVRLSRIVKFILVW